MTNKSTLVEIVITYPREPEVASGATAEILSL